MLHTMLWYGCNVPEPLHAVPFLFFPPGVCHSPLLSLSAGLLCMFRLSVWAGSSLEGVAVFAQQPGAGCPWSAFPRVLCFWGIQLVFFFFFFFFFFPHCITYELCCLPLWDWELRLMSTEHSSGYFVAAQRNSEGRQKLFRALTLASGGEMTWNITSDFLLKTLSTDTVKWQNQSQRKNVSMSQFGSWILHTPSKTKLKSALPPKPGSREVEPMLL